MSDEDRAQELELKGWEWNNRSRDEVKKYEPGEAGYGPQECDDCGDDIPEKRRSHGYRLCVACKSDQERRDATWSP